jgi:hypothetical protein
VSRELALALLLFGHATGKAGIGFDRLGLAGRNIAFALVKEGSATQAVP